MLDWLKNLFMGKPKPKDPCPKCKDTGEILRPTFQIGSMTEYEVIKCSCKKLKKK